MRYSLIIPVYNRPEELDELLQSLTIQRFTDFEVIIVEDGSQIPCKEIVEKYASKLNVHYFAKENSGPGQSRNYGARHSKGEYLIILDSDCVLPQNYLNAIEFELKEKDADAFGGPDCAHDSFTAIQKAINYSMTSFFTTGGIRGGAKQMDKFYPRSFNMGVRAQVYHTLQGFSDMRFGEDIDFSIRIFKGGYACRLFPQAWVWHKRRADLKKFFKQVHNSGIARINLYKKYPESLKIVHLLPACFTVTSAILLLATLVGCVGMMWIFQMQHKYPYAVEMPWLQQYEPVLSVLAWCPLLPLLLFSIMIILDASFKNKCVKIGFLAVAASYVQLIGYGTGFLRAWWKRCVCRKSEFAAFQKNFYK